MKEWWHYQCSRGRRRELAQRFIEEKGGGGEDLDPSTSDLAPKGKAVGALRRGGKGRPMRRPPSAVKEEGKRGKEKDPSITIALDQGRKDEEA